jgi:hypothetical protein
MKYIIKNILKENYVNKSNDQKYLNFVLDEMLDGVEIEKYYPSNPTFSNFMEFLDLYAYDEYDKIVSNREYFNKLGWEEVEYGDGWYYFRVDNPEEEYDSNDFYIELGYDWLRYLEEVREVRIVKKDTTLEKTLDYSHNEWSLVHPDLMMDLNINDKSIFQCRLNRLVTKHKYDSPVVNLNKSYNFIALKIMRLYKISPEEFETIFTKFKKMLQKILKDRWGVDIVPNDNVISESIVDDFIEFGKEELSLDGGFNIRLTDDNDELETLASYDMSDNIITVLQKNRAVPDIIRSIAHEMVHHKQNEMGDLKGNPEEGEDGSPWEDQANSKAGELVRLFGREYPEIYDL